MKCRTGANKEKGDKRGSERLALLEQLELQTPEEDSRRRGSHIVTAAHTTSDKERRRDAGRAHWQRCIKRGEEVTGKFWVDVNESKWCKSTESQLALVTERSWQAGGASLGLLSAQGAGRPITDTTKLCKCHLPSRRRPTPLPGIMRRCSLRKDLHF